MSEPVTIAHYRITGKLGAGGMGAVYRATDTKLNREVAIKMLPPAFADDPQYLARFQREAQTLASLQHANIATIFGVEEGALVMELVEGPTLAERIGLGPVPLDEALEIARQIVDGLEAAHERGIIHRDLKPANIKVTPDGAVKILDFGLAKAAQETAAANVSNSVSPTMSLAMTQAGYILGTAGYMAPEQARGKPVDKRADIWAFGVVLFEMLTGKVTFAGETVSDTLAAVLRADLDFGQLPVETPPAVRRLLRRCLERERKLRLADIADARLELIAKEEPPAPAAAAPVPARRSRITWVLAAVIPLAAAAGWFLRPAPPVPVLPGQFEIPAPAGYSFGRGGHSISPDGRTLAMRLFDGAGLARIFLRPLDRPVPRELPDTAGVATYVWSPDSRSLLVLKAGKWRILEIEGGASTALCDAPGASRGAAWSANGTILIGAASSPLHRIPASGGKLVPVTTVDKTRHTGHGFPVFLPGGRFILYSAFGSPNSLWIGDLEGKELARKLLDMSGVDARYAADPASGMGLILFRNADVVRGVRFDPRSRNVISEPFTFLEEVDDSSVANLAISVSDPARVLLYSDGMGQARNEELALLDRTGKKVSTLTPAGEFDWGHLEFAPDGKSVVGSRSKDRQTDLWSVDLARGTVTRITFDGGEDKAPGFSFDGSRVVYSRSAGVDGSGIYAGSANGVGSPSQLWKGSAHHIGVSPDGRWIAFEGRRRNVYLIDTTRPGSDQPLLTGDAAYSWPQFSPDGKWLAYVSSETGRAEVHVQSFPPGKGKWQVSRNGGRLARWRRDGRELIFVDGHGEVRFHSVAVKPSSAGLEFGAPEPLFGVTASGRAGSTYFALSPDGQRIALLLPVAQAAQQNLTLMLDWMPGLKVGK